MLFNAIDLDGNGEIKKSEFLVALDNGNLEMTDAIKTYVGVIGDRVGVVGWVVVVVIWAGCLGVPSLLILFVLVVVVVSMLHFTCTCPQTIV